MLYDFEPQTRAAYRRHLETALASTDPRTLIRALRGAEKAASLMLLGDVACDLDTLATRCEIASPESTADRDARRDVCALLGEVLS